MSSQDRKQAIIDSLQAFSEGDLAKNALHFFDSIGYTSEKRPAEFSGVPADFVNDYGSTGILNSNKALLDQWQSIYLLLQLTSDEIKSGSQLMLDFGTEKKVNNTIIESYLFFTIELTAGYYTRTQLASITREINKLFPMPVMILFRHEDTLTLSIINRRLHKRDESKDVLEKVTLIKDINFTAPHRAHIEILFDLSLDELYQQHGFTSFVELHRAWQKVLDSSELNKRFFSEIANWYFWAIQHVTFPKDAGKGKEVRNATSVIRLITRLIFIWFIKEKQLVPDDLFDQRKLNRILNYSDANGSTYYKAILQNLFFATLNQEMNTPDKPDNRKFRSRNKLAGGRDPHFNITNLYRYENYFQNPSQTLDLFSQIPFLNGGLFECLDKPDKDDPSKILRIDGFSDRADNELCLPDFLFFSEEREVDLNEEYGTKNKRYKVRGLIDILNRYKFTIEENTPIEEEIALDPELLGKVFENLLANYNPETKTTARKQTGSYYTPRGIVNYMVDESLIAYLGTCLKEKVPSLADMEELPELLREVFAYTEKIHPFNEEEVTALIDAIYNIKVLDPACGSAAFPMGILHKLVFILGKLDPQNELWKNKQLSKATEISDITVREKLIEEIEESFERNELDYGRKLYLIENCIYGVDIQSIAVQIAKLRFFISLIVNQKLDDSRQNRGILPLPNLETKFVAANTLIGLDRPQQLVLRNSAIDQKEEELDNIRQRHFSARNQRTKQRCREDDARLRTEISGLLKKDGFPRESTEKLAYWDPYDQSASADFFDPEWMFGIENGFNVVVGNPPYINAIDFRNIYGDRLREEYNHRFETARGTYDVFVLFFEKGLALLTVAGFLCLITPNKYLSSKYAVALRSHILELSTVKHLVDLSSINVFKGSSVYPVITILMKEGCTEKPSISLLHPINKEEDVFDIEKFQLSTVPHHMLTMLPENLWGFLLSDKAKFLQSLIDRTEPLSDYGEISATSTASESDIYGAYFSNDKKQTSLKVVNTGTIDRYSTLWGIKELKHGGSSYLTPYLPLNKANISQRRREMYRSPKILFAKMAISCEAFLDQKGEYASVNTNCFYAPNAGVSLKYILAYCNSKLFMFFYEQLFGALRMSGGYFQFQAPQLRVIPILYPTSEDIIAKLESTVDDIHSMKQENPCKDTTELENQIDQMIYKLYNISEREVKIIESSGAKGGKGN